MITKIETPNELKTGVPYRMYQVDDELAAAQVVDIGQKAYLFKSNIIKAWYLFVEIV